MEQQGKKRYSCLYFSPQSWKSTCGFSGCKALKSGFYGQRQVWRTRTQLPNPSVGHSKERFPTENLCIVPTWGTWGHFVLSCFALCLFQDKHRWALVCQDSTSISIYGLSQSFWRGRYFLWITLLAVFWKPGNSHIMLNVLVTHTDSLFPSSLIWLWSFG